MFAVDKPGELVYLCFAGLGKEEQQTRVKQKHYFVGRIDPDAFIG